MSERDPRATQTQPTAGAAATESGPIIPISSKGRASLPGQTSPSATVTAIRAGLADVFGPDASDTGQWLEQVRAPGARQTVVMEDPAALAERLASGQTPSPDLDAASDFVLRERIGAGGQGEVWRAWQTRLGREVAVKRLRSDGNVREFLMEALTTAELDHPNIVPVHDLGSALFDDGESPLIAMKLARGTPWNDLIERERAAKNFSLEDFLARHLRVLGDVCHAVAYAHAKKIIHRDLKPHQVIVGEFGEVYLMDWGLAVGLDDAAKTSPALGGVPRRHTLRTASNQTGTPAYMAPEQTGASAQVLGFHTDIYLLGAILFELIAGMPPHAGAQASDAYRAARKNEIRPIPDACPPELAATVRKALATEPAERHRSVADFRAEVEEYLSGSGRRRESVEIAAEAAAALENSQAQALGYTELTRLRMRLSRALQLWPENVRAQEAMGSVMIAGARSALAEGDLRLAESLAEALPEPDPRRQEVMAGVSAERARRRRQERQRLGAMVAAGGLLVLLALAMAHHSRQQRLAYDQVALERDRAEDALRRAEQARQAEAESRARAEQARQAEAETRGRAEDLMSFMLYDLRDGLQPLGRLDLLEKVALKARDYYAALPESANPGDIRKRAAAIHNLGKVFGYQGRPDDAEAAQRQALGMIEKAIRESGLSDDPYWQAALAQHQAAWANALGFLGRLEECIEQTRLALSLYQKILEGGQSEDPDGLRHDIVICAYHMSGYLLEAERHQEALETLEPVLEVIDQMAEHWKDYPQLPKVAATSWSLYGRALDGLDRDEEALAASQKAVERGRRALRDNPDSIYGLEALIPALNGMAISLSKLGRLDEAMDTYRETIALSEAFCQRDPANLDLRQELGMYWRNMGLLASARSQGEQATGFYRQAISILDKMPEGNPDNAKWHWNLLLSQNLLLMGLIERGAFPEAAAEAERGAQMAERAMAAGEHSAEVGQSYRNVFFYNAACGWARAGEAERSFENLARAFETGFEDAELAWTDSDLELLRQSNPAWFEAIAGPPPAPAETLAPTDPEQPASPPSENAPKEAAATIAESPAETAAEVVSAGASEPAAVSTP
jgi:tetratricopeptide (TPR) repeat protein